MNRNFLWTMGWLGCLAVAGAPAWGAPAPGTIAVYSDGRVVKLLETRQKATVWQDHRLRRITYPANPVLPPRQRIGLDGRLQYREILDQGNPAGLLEAAPGTTVDFRTQRVNAKGVTSSRNYQCTALGPDRVRVLGRDEPVRRFRCERYTVHHKLWTRQVKEIRELAYSPRLRLIVDQVRRRPAKGTVRERRLVALIPPGKYRYADLRSLLAAQHGGTAQ